MDFDGPRPQFSDLSLPSSLGSPMAVPSEDFSIPGGQDSSQGSSKPASCPLSDPNQSNREQAFRTEFNLIYTCSPLNANLGNPITLDRRLLRSEGTFSPAESFHSSISGQGLLGDVGTGSVSPYSEAHYVGAYLDSGTPPHITNPPQKKKASYVHVNANAMWSVLRAHNVPLYFVTWSIPKRVCLWSDDVALIPSCSSSFALPWHFLPVSLPLFFQGRGPTRKPLVCWQGGHITRLLM